MPAGSMLSGARAGLGACPGPASATRPDAGGEDVRHHRPLGDPTAHAVWAAVLVRNRSPRGAPTVSPGQAGLGGHRGAGLGSANCGNHASSEPQVGQEMSTSAE